VTAPGPFSAAARARHLAALPAERWDLLVVGAGVTGAGVAREAALRGLRAAVVDGGDLGSGTSSRSSRLVHGGLRYLETFDFRLVFEASAERRRLLRLAPHLVRPLQFLFPLYRGGGLGPPKLRAGMWLYDSLSLFRNIGRHRMLPPARARAEEPGLRADGLLGAAAYWDAAVDDARLALATARAAHDAGAAVVPHAEVTGFLHAAEGIRGVRLRDRLSGRTLDVSARLVVNATGPWSDTLRRLADPGAKPRLRPTKGVHVMLRRARVGNRHAITLRSPLDGRVMFVLPWGEHTYVGTTDTDFDGSPSAAVATREDVDYLLASANAVFPDAALTTDDVLSTWAGVRPLLAPAEEGRSAGATSREHEIWRDRGGLLNVAGGKLTTYRVMAREVADEAARVLAEEHAVRAAPDAGTDVLPLPGAPDDMDALSARVRETCARLGLPETTADHLSAAYGTDAEAILADVADDLSLGAPLVPGLPYVRAEVRHAVAREMTTTLDDVLTRRMHVFYEAADGGLSAAREVAEEMAAMEGIGWDDAAVEAQVAAYRRAVQETRGF
jgi:glycerol-3-phosphate dehydrogenase